MKSRRLPRSTRIRFAVWVALLGSAFVLARWTPLGELVDEERVVALLAEVRGAAWAPPALILLYVTLAPSGLPMTPLIVGGAAFGPVYGAIYNTVGLFLGAATSFAVARYLGRDAVARLAGRRLRRVERFLDRRGFWPLVQTRFLPLPFAVVNFASALAGVRLPLFLWASLVGLLPSTLIHSVFIARLFEQRGTERWLTAGGYLLTFVLFNVALSVPSLRERARRRRRYEALVAGRAGRRAREGSF